jgi:hypothetical protein
VTRLSEKRGVRDALVNYLIGIDGGKLEMVLEPSTLIELLKLVPGIVTSLGDRLQAARDKPWEQISISLDMLEKLSSLHVKAVGQVTAPILEEGDILSTCRNYQALVNNPDFPAGYGAARGVLETALSFDRFRKGTIRDKLKAVLVELGGFQHAVFMLEYDSYRMADAFERARELGLLLAPGQPRPDSQVADLRQKVDDAFRGSFQWLAAEQGQPVPLDVPPLLTSDAVVELVRTWCREWQRHVQRTLYGGRGLHYAIGQLGMERHR